MIEKLANKVSGYMVRQGACQAEDLEVISFGFYSLLSDAIQIMILLAVSLPFGAAPHMAVYAVSYGALRRNTGGAHAGSHLGCICIYTAVSFCSVALGRYILLPHARIAAPCIAAFAVAAVFLFAPVTHPDFPRKPRALRRFKRRGRGIVIAECLIITLCAVFAPDPFQPFVMCAGIGCGVATATLLPRIHIKNTRKGDNDEQLENEGTKRDV